MMIATVNEGDGNLGAGEGARGAEAGESAADDDHPGQLVWHGFAPERGLAWNIIARGGECESVKCGSVKEGCFGTGGGANNPG